jgi:hypothetical protein
MHPPAEGASVVLHAEQHRRVDEHASQIGIAALADTEQSGATARRGRAWS